VISKEMSRRKCNLRTRITSKKKKAKSKWSLLKRRLKTIKKRAIRMTRTWSMTRKLWRAWKMSRLKARGKKMR
jgi:hypothetical protein